MSEESKKGIYDQSSFDAIKLDFMAQYQNIPRRLGKLKRRTGASRRTVCEPLS